MRFYISDLDRTNVIALPCPPQEVKVKRTQHNETFETINMNDLRTIGLMGLYSLSISSFFPCKSYSFIYDDTYKGMEYVHIFEKWRESRSPLRLVITDIDINIAISLDEFEYGIQDGTADIYYTMLCTEFRLV
jgi:hypothetical protein